MTIPIYIAPGKNLRGLVTFHGFDQEPVGLGKDGNPVKLGFQRTDLAALFTETSRRDSHLVCYAIEDSEGNFLDRMPRLRKDSLDAIRAAGWLVRCRTVFLDLDLKDLVGRSGVQDPPKLLWYELTEDEKNVVWKKIEEARLRLKDKGMEWAGSYTTRGGFRFLHLLSMPVDAGAPFEALVGRFLTAYSLVGLPVDEACKDWTRLFRAPQVTLESGLQTWGEEWFTSVLADLDDDEAFYTPRPADLRPENVAPDVEIERTSTREVPDPIQAQALVEFYDDETRKMKWTTPGKAARAALKESAVYPWVFEKAPLAFPGKRHEMLTRAVGEVVATLHGMQNVAPEFIFGLLYEPAGRLGEDEDWTGKLWEMTTSFWDKEELKKAQKAAVVAEKVAEHEKETGSKMERFLKGVRTWCVEIASMSDEDAIEFIRTSKIGVLQDARRELFHVLMDNGYYDEHPCSSTTLSRVIEQRGMQWLVPTEYSKVDAKGNTTLTKLPPHALLEQSTTVYSSEEIRLDRRGSYLKRDQEGREVFVHVPFYLRDDVEPEFVQAIYDSWMAAAGGNEELGKQMLTAIASLLLFQYGPTAAVLLYGSGNAGKSLTSLGLAECISTRRVADGATLTDNFNDTLRISPIIHVDEALDRGSKGIDASASLRRLITATSLAIEQKGKDKVYMQGVHRVLMTANSPDILTSLLGGKVRSDSDMNAIAERVAVFQLDDAATAWFVENNAGWRLTRDWIGTYGRTGLYAKFWFWCIQNLVKWKDGKPVMRGRRLLYEGNARNALLQELEANTGPIPDIVLAINRLMQQERTPKVVLDVGPGKLWVQINPILKECAGQNSEFSTHEIRHALQAMLLPNQPSKDDRVCIKGQQARWKALDARKVLRLIQSHVDPHPAFAELSKKP